MKKTTIFLAGDSTVQTYKTKDFPQCGWGAMLWKYFSDKDVVVIHPMDTEFDNVTRYEMADLVIDNRAMAGRSCRSFFDEGRWADLLKNVSEGDYVLYQFAHNDANREKEERFISPENYKEKLIRDYINPVLEKKAYPVLVTAIAMKDFDDKGRCRISFPEYREKCLEIGSELGTDVIDLGKKTADYNTAIGEDACREIYMNLRPLMYPASSEGKGDNAHLRAEGAFIYAGFVYEELKKLL